MRRTKRLVIVAGAAILGGGAALFAVLSVDNAVKTAPDGRNIEDAITAERAPTKLTKDQVRSSVKRVAPMLTDCYERARAREPQISGVINTKLAIDNDPGRGMTLSVKGFDTSGPLGESREFLDCVTKQIESADLPPIAERGRLELTYPMTFAPRPPNNKDTAIVDKAAHAVSEGRWGEALQDAEQGLRLTSLDGTFRRRLIEVAGLAACHLKNEAKARDYFALAPANVEGNLQQTCMQVAMIDLTK